MIIPASKVIHKQWDEFIKIYEWAKKEIDIKETIYCNYLREFVKDESYILKGKLNNIDILHL